MSQSSTIDAAIKFAQQVLDTAPGDSVNIKHNFNYLSRKSKATNKANGSPQARVVYAGPGQAKLIELKEPPRDQRAGRFPQHNTGGDFDINLPILPSVTLDDYRDLHSVFSLEEAGFCKQNVSLTKKKIAKIALQFAHLSVDCFKEMLCLQSELEKRDFEVWVKEESETKFHIAYINPHNLLIQFTQTIIIDDENKVVDLRHVVYETSMPLVINQTLIDLDSRIRNIAHVGITGSVSNSFMNSLERFNDGTLVWTTSDFKFGKQITGSAALKEDGQVIILKNCDKKLAEFSARNLGAEGIDPVSLAWTGGFAFEACLPEIKDKYIMRREYKAAVRKQVNQIIDGACIPGLDPIFKIPQIDGLVL